MRVTFSDQAVIDLERAFAWYLQTGDLMLATRFRDAVDHALAHLVRNPGMGSARYSRVGSQDVLPFWVLRRFPYSVFYLAETERLHVVRVLHQAGDIPQHLQQP